MSEKYLRNKKKATVKPRLEILGDLGALEKSSLGGLFIGIMGKCGMKRLNREYKEKPDKGTDYEQWHK